MSDTSCPRRGYGREAVRLAPAFIRPFPRGEAACRRLYSRFGFEETGGMDGNERIAVPRQGGEK